MHQEKQGRVVRSFQRLLHSRAAAPPELDPRSPALQGTNQNYCKFIILAHQRSGSSMLIDTLRKHPQIVGLGELFIPSRMGFNYEEFDGTSEALRVFRDEHPTEFLDRYIFGAYNDEIQAIGFKLFPEQIEFRAFQGLWRWLEKRTDIKILYLTRRNLLATYVSLLIAQKDGKYGIKDAAERTQSTISIDPHQCLMEFKSRKQHNAEIERHIRDHRVLNLAYEDVAQCPDDYVQQVQEFLGVDVRDLKITTVRQEVRPLSEVIENYDELRQYFYGTEWGYLFPAAEGTDSTSESNERLPKALANARRKAFWNDMRTYKRQKRFVRRMAVGLTASLAVVAVLLFNSRLNKAVPIEKTVSAIRDVASRIGMYVQEHSALPQQLEAVPLPGGAQEHPKDGWSHPLRYEVDGENEFKLISLGSDDAFGGTGDAADIVCTYQVVNGSVRDIQ
jgi:LPS sulfotransferase NodH